MKGQTTLDFELPYQQSFDNFIVGQNSELLQALQDPRSEFCCYWLHGVEGSGRSHLLRAACLAAHSEGLQSSYVGCQDFGHAELLEGALKIVAEHGSGIAVVALDDINSILGNVALELQLMTVYQRLLDQHGRLLISHSKPATQVEFALQDLASRMRGAEHFSLRGLDDEHKRELLIERAASRGYELTAQVVDYWLARGPRELNALLIDLDALDRASLVRQQKVTVPLLKQVLGY